MNVCREMRTFPWPRKRFALVAPTTEMHAHKFIPYDTKRKTFRHKSSASVASNSNLGNKINKSTRIYLSKQNCALALGHTCYMKKLACFLVGQSICWFKRNKKLGDIGLNDFSELIAQIWGTDKWRWRFRSKCLFFGRINLCARIKSRAVKNFAHLPTEIHIHGDNII